MNINISYDSSVGSAPAGFTATVQSAVFFLETNYTDAVTINVAVGYGEIAGQPLDPGALGESLTNLISTSYGQLRSALIADAITGADASAIASLPVADPTGGHYYVSTAEAKALGLYSGNGIDGYIGFRAGATNFDFDRSDGIASGAYDFFGVFLHEITEVMGRQLFAGETVGGTPNSFEPEDLFHYAASHARSFSGATPGYFSVDDGATNLVSFNTNASGDFGDWASSAVTDAYRAFAVSGAVTTISDADMIVMDAIGWDEAALPDLLVGNFTPAGASISLRIDNTGTADAAASTAGIYLSSNSTITASDTLLATVAIGALSVGQTQTELANLVLPDNLTPGTYYLGALADIGNAAVEMREFNNASTGLPIILGNNAANSLTGTSKTDTMMGFTGNDTLNGGAGKDFLFGGDGDDRYVVDIVTDTVIENADEGTDTVQSPVSFTLASNIENLILTGSSALNGTGNESSNNLLGNSGANILAGLAGADTIDGAGGQDTATYAVSAAGIGISLMTGIASGGDAAGDVLLDIENLTGSAFNDTIEGSAANNVLVAGGGIDTLSYEHAGAAIKISLALTSAQNTGGAGIDTVSQFENLIGSDFNDTLTGSSSANRLSGGAGNDCIDGGGSADTMMGGVGDDAYVVDKSTDSVSENSGEGADIVFSSITYALAVNLEALTLAGSGAINGTGNAGANAITGNSGNNVLIGLAGADTLDGASGTDTASYAGSVSGVNVSLAAGTASNGDAAGDVLLNIENITGSSAADTIEGDGGNNVLSGGNGADLLSYAHAAGGVSVNLSLSTAQNTGAAGIDTLTLFENLAGSALNDSLTGSSAANSIDGGDGDDSVNGGGGNDTLNGGAGADVLTGGSGADRFQFFDFAVGPVLDRIADFSHSQVDRIDLSAIDANANAGGDQAFVLIGNAGFHAIAGELNYASTGTGVAVSGDTDGDGLADFTFNVDGSAAPVSGDFIL